MDFHVTTSNAEAAKFFNQGLAQFHGFWFFEAERSFRQALLLDPRLTMAYWGMALANVENPRRAKEFIAKAKEKLAEVPDLEKPWINSLVRFYDASPDGKNKAALRNLVRDYEAIVVAQPDQIEAKALLVHQIWRNDSSDGIKITSHLAVDTLAREVLKAKPNHPVHHYRIHLWNGEKDERALDSAALCGQSAPGIAHMWHMPGHTFSSLKRYADAAWQQEAAHRTDHAQMLRNRTMPDETHNYSHNAEWLIRDLIHTGRAHEAMELAIGLVEEPRIPRSRQLNDEPKQEWKAGGSSYEYGKERLLDICLTFEWWPTLTRLAETPWLPADGDDAWLARRALALQLAWFHQQQPEKAAACLDVLRKQLKPLETEPRHFAGAALFKAPGADAAVIFVQSMTNWLKTQKPLANGAPNPGALKSAAPSARKSLAKPLAQILDEAEAWSFLQEGKRDEAVKKFLAAKDVPATRGIRFALETNDLKKAEELARKTAADHQGELAPLALLVEVLEKAGKKDEACQKFTELRALASNTEPSDLSLPSLARLAPLAAEMGLPADWRLPPVVAKDAGQRPPLDSLGLRNWTPAPAPAWEARDSIGQATTSASLAGKPYILLFYLGKGCTHCMAQLNAFAPLHKQFADAGLPLFAVSTDTPEGLAKTLAAPKEGEEQPFPFPLLSDAAGSDLPSFRAFRAYDDFEAKPIHGTILVDGQGRIRWQHLSYEPFVKPEFLLQEAKRLLKFDGLASPKVAGLWESLPQGSAEGD